MLPRLINAAGCEQTFVQSTLLSGSAVSAIVKGKGGVVQLGISELKESLPGASDTAMLSGGTVSAIMKGKGGVLQQGISELKVVRNFI